MLPAARQPGLGLGRAQAFTIDEREPVGRGQRVGRQRSCVTGMGRTLSATYFSVRMHQ